MKLYIDQITIAAGGIQSTQQWTCDLVSTHHYCLSSSHRTSQSVSCEGEHVPARMCGLSYPEDLGLHLFERENAGKGWSQGDHFPF